MKTKVNEVPLVGPKGRKELLKRINELEAQVAQQDYLRIKIQSAEQLSEQEAATIKKLVDNGTVYDALIEYGADGWESRVVSVNREQKYIVLAYYDAETAPWPISYDY